MRKLNKFVPLIFAVVVIVIGLLPLWIKDPSKVDILVKIGFAAVIGLSWRLIYATGQIDNSRGAFVGIGAYASAILTKVVGLPFWWAWPLAGGVAAIIGLILGIPTLRVKGIYFVILTFAFNEVIRLILLAWKGLTRGPDGFQDIPLPSVGGFHATPKSIIFFYIMLFLALITILIMYRLERSRVGLTFRAIKQADNLAESLGVNLMWYKVVAFVIACFLTGLAGSFFAHYNVNIAPYDFGFDLSINSIVYAVVGGVGSVFGPLLGGALLVPVGRILLSYGQYELISYGALLIAVPLALPGGIAAIPRRIINVFRKPVRAKAVRTTTRGAA